MRSRLGIVGTLGFTQTLAWASTYYLPAILAVPIAGELRLSPSWIYAGLSLGLGVSAFLGPGLGRMIDRRGGRRVICGSNIAFAVGLVMLGECIGPRTLLLSWLVLGVAMAAGLYEPAFAALTRLYGHDSRGAITGVTLIAGFASTVGWPISTLLEHKLGWRGACVAWAAFHGAIGLPLNAWCLSQKLKAATAEPSAPSRIIADHQRKTDRLMRILAFMFTASGIVSIGMATNLPRLFTVIGASPAAGIAAASLMGPAQVIARILEYSARHRVNPLLSAKVASVLHPIACLLVALAGAPAASLFAVIHGAGNGMLTIVRGTLPLAIFGPDGYGARIGKISAPARIGQALGPFAIGLFIDRMGAATLIISAGLSLAAFSSLFLLSLPRADGRQTSISG
jgi:MFS family permease